MPAPAALIRALLLLGGWCGLAHAQPPDATTGAGRPLPPTVDLRLTAGPGPDLSPDEAAPEVGRVRFRGRFGAPRAQLQLLCRPLIEDRATEARIADALNALSALPSVGALSVNIRRKARSDQADVIFKVAGPRRLVGRLRITTSGSGPGEDVDAERLMRLVQSSPDPLRLVEGHPFHPWTLKRDTRALVRYFQAAGHLNAKVRAEVTEEGGITNITFRVRTGARLTVRRVQLTGPGGGVLPGPLAQQLQAVDRRIGEGAAPAPELIRADAHRLRRALCEAEGRPDARVEVQATVSRAQADLTYQVSPGHLAVIGQVDQLKQSLPDDFLKTHGLERGRPFCPDTLEALKAATRARLMRDGFPHPEIGWAVVSEEARPDGRREVRIALSVQPQTRAIIKRIWFEGAAVTRRSLMEALIVVHPGDPYNPEAIDESVQNLLRTGLFRRVNARVVDAGRGQAFLYIQVRERELVSLNLEREELTFHNMDFSRWPDELGAVTDGVSLRGGGQRLILRGREEHQRLRLRDPFVLPRFLFELELERRVHTFEDLTETVWRGHIGYGLRAWKNRITLLPTVGIEGVIQKDPDRYNALPISDRDDVRSPFGVEGRLDLRLVDGERIAWGGALLYGDVTNIGIPGAGSPDIQRYTAAGRFYIPLGTNREAQNYVLFLRAEGRWLVSDDEGRLTAYERIRPRIRGYTRSSVTVPFYVPDADGDGTELIELGGTRAYEGTVSVRMPVFGKRRTAISPFLDVATVGDPTNGQSAFDEIYPAVGLRLDFSFLNERLEGFVHFSWPLRRDVSNDFTGAGAGGSF